jgi:chemotaxis protein methyltransferase WspC
MNVDLIRELLQTRLGVDAHALGPAVLHAALNARLAALGLSDLAAYADRVAGSAEELACLADEVVVPETWFFRGGAVFAFVAEHVRAAPGRPFHILSAPCSSGEEPYSLAIALAEAGVPREAWSLEAIDLSRRSLDRARRGFYREAAFRETPPEVRRKYFRPALGGWEIDPALRAAVRFRQGNLIDPLVLAGEGPFDLIFCRNLLIYLHAAARAQVLANLGRLLAPGGLLCAGHAEPLGLLDRRYRPVGPPAYFLFRREEASAEPLAPPGFVGQVFQPVRSADRLENLSCKAGPGPDLLARARRQADAGDLDAALASCRAHAAEAGASADLYSLMGVIHQAREEAGAAAGCFRKALYLEPGHREALTHLMLLHQHQGRTDAAALLRLRLERSTAGGEP